MKKRTLSTLLLAGVMAATMIPTAVFAGTTLPSQKTTVGYTAGGNTSTDGHIMVTVPVDVTFKDAKPVSGFNVEAKVWNAEKGSWETPSATNPLGVTDGITVSVASTEGFHLRRSTGNKKGEGTYQYSITGGDAGNKQDLTSTTDADDESADKQAKVIGKLVDTDGGKYTINGSVSMTKTPQAGQSDKGTLFKDTLTYTFAGM